MVAMASSMSCLGSTGLGASVMRSVPDWVLGKAITSRMRLAVEHEHDEAVEAEGDAAVGRGAEAEGVEEEGEFFLGVFGGDAQEAEDFGLEVLAVDTDGAAAEFDAVEDDVVGLGADLRGVGVEQGRCPRPAGR